MSSNEAVDAFSLCSLLVAHCSLLKPVPYYCNQLMKITWHDPEEIAIRLAETHPDVDPLSVRFTDLRDWVLALPDFEDDPAASNEGVLEAIQMAWVEEKQ